MSAVPPANLIDIASDDDAGEWLAALPFVRFPVSDYEAVHDAGRRLPNADGLVALIPFNHDPEVGQ